MRLTCDRLVFPPAQIALFPEERQNREKQDRIVAAIDRVERMEDAVAAARSLHGAGTTRVKWASATRHYVLTDSMPSTRTARLITEDEVDVLVCGTLSGNSMAIMPIATENEIPLISMASARAIIEEPYSGVTG